MTHISIITTTYKHQDFIARTIESILGQTYTDWELFIGDDSPDDATWNVIQEYVAKYPDKIKARHHTPNKGIVDNMNFLIAKISPHSQYIAFLEGDDMYTSDNLEKKLQIFTQYPDMGLVYSDISFIDADDHIILPSLNTFRKIPVYIDKTLSIDEIIRHPLGPIVSWSNMMTTKKILQKFPPRDCINEPKMNSVSDYDFQCQVTSSYPIYCINESLILYRRHSTNTSGPNQKNYDRLFDIDKLIVFYYTNKKITDQTMKRKRSNLYATFALMALERGDKGSGRKFWKQSRGFSITSSIIIKLLLIPLFIIPIGLLQIVLKKLVKR